MDRNDRNTTGLYGDNRGAPYEMHRDNRSQLLSKMIFPATYTSNTQKEDLVLEAVENFRAQYVALYPTRTPLLLSPQNECGFRKFISTFIRPTALKFDELYDYNTCAQYLANYVQYEQLDDPEVLPTKVVSPSTVLTWQVGNCIEMSLLLASVLIGTGYNAFVVVGYAAREVCENDQSKTLWPGKLPEERCSDDEAEVKPPPSTEYTQHLRQRPQLVSDFDKQKAARDKKQREDDMRIDVDDARLNLQAEEEDPDIQYFHSWVVIIPGKRGGLTQPIFVEPSTGASMPAKEADKYYFGIESIFNHHNYFANLNPGTPVGHLSYDLRDLQHWEHIFLRDADMEEDEDTDKSRTITDDATADNGEGGDMTLDLPSSWVSPLTLSRMQYENRYPGRMKEVKYSNATVRYFAEYSEPDLKVLSALVPDDSSVHMQVHTFYKHRQDKLRRRSVYPQEHSTNPRKIHDWFLPGRKKETKVEGLRELIFEPGVQRTMKFYWRAREDGLARRKESFFHDTAVRKIQEYYFGRDDDRLNYRGATFEPPRDSHGAGTLQYAMSAAVGAKDHARSEPIKMTEKFDRNPSKSADDDVQKRSFIKPQSSDGEVWVFYHYRGDCITRPYRLFPKNAEKEKDSVVAAADTKPKVITMPYSEPPKDSDLSDQLRFLLDRENDCLTEIRSKADECKDILNTLESEQKTVLRVLSTYDTLRNRPKETEAELAQMLAEESRRAESRKDYLAPYIAKLEIAKQCKGDYSNVRLTTDQAKQVRDEALRELKERLIQRGHIMQARMDREKEELNRRQMSYQKNLDAADGSKESEEFAQFCKDATWRMKILDERLSRHIDQASEKYAQLAQRLAEDKRLAALYQQ